MVARMGKLRTVVLAAQKCAFRAEMTVDCSLVSLTSPYNLVSKPAALVSGATDRSANLPKWSRNSLSEDVFHSRVNSFFSVRVRQNVELALANCFEDGGGDLGRRHPRLYELAQRFEPCFGYRIHWLRRPVRGAVSRQLHDPCVDNARTEHRDLD